MEGIINGGEVMANEKNLKPIDSEKLARELQLKSAEKRKQNRKEKLVIKEMLEKRLKAKDLREIADNLIERAKKSSDSFQVLQTALGQKPVEESKVEIEGNIPVMIVDDLNED